MALNPGVQKYQARIRSEKREQILRASETLMLNNGYDKTSVAEIAKLAGISLATFYKHFPTKPDILAALCDFIITDSVSKLDDPIHDDQPIDVALREIASGYVDIITDERLRKLFRLIIAEVPYFPELGEIFYERIKKPVYERLYVYIRNKADQGILNVDNEQQAAAIIMSLLNHSLMLGPLYTNIDPRQDETLNIQEIIARSVENFLKIHLNSSPAV